MEGIHCIVYVDTASLCQQIWSLTLKQLAAFSYNGPACSQSLFILKDIKDGLVSLCAAFHSLSPSASAILHS